MKFQTECRNFSAPKMFKLRFSITITQWQPKPTRHYQHGSWCELVKRTRFLGNQKTTGKQHLTRNMPEEYKVRLCFREAGSSVEQCSKCFDVRNSNCAKSLLPFLIHFNSKVSLVRCGKTTEWTRKWQTSTHASASSASMVRGMPVRPCVIWMRWDSDVKTRNLKGNVNLMIYSHVN